MSDISTSALTSRISILKMYNAGVYSDASHAACAYSYSLGKSLHGYSEIDSSVSSILRSYVHTALQAEQETDQQTAVKAVVYPVFFAEPQYSQQSDSEAETLLLLQNLNALEINTYQFLEQAAQEPAASRIDIISIPGLAVASKARVREIQSIFKEIQGDVFWIRPEPVNWICLQCGFVIKSPNAFDECQCCGAGREFASN